MKIIHSSISNLSTMSFRKKTCILSGNFDGVHCAHNVLLQELVVQSNRENLSSCLILFSPHPSLYFNKENSNFLLTLQDEKISLLKNYDIEYIIFLEFDKTLSSLSPYKFLENINKNLKPARWISGPDYHFGKDRKGDISLLWNFASQNSIIITIMPYYFLEGVKVSSTKIREYLKKRELKKANLLLGYPYRLTGRVVEGESRGRKIGFKTANMEYFKEKCIPGNGVYKVNVKIQGKNFNGVLNIGKRPTFGKDNERVVEVHILEHEGSIYNENIEIEFLDFIREERKFHNPEELKNQIKKDIEYAKA